MPKVNWRRDDTPYMNDPKFTAPIEYEVFADHPQVPATPPLSTDRREHTNASAGKDFESGLS